MRTTLKRLLEQALESLRDSGDMDLAQWPEIPLERSRGGEHGEFASPVALSLARPLRRNPREIAAAIVARLPDNDLVARVAIAGPGYINFFIAATAITQTLADILSTGKRYGFSEPRGGGRIQVEFVSANPTGPLHVGHGRGAAFGAALANLLEAAGYQVQREYYVNDAGRQMDILALSLWLRYLQDAGESLDFPANAYQGEYVKAMAAELRLAAGDRFKQPPPTVFADIPEDVPEGIQASIPVYGKFLFMR